MQPEVKRRKIGVIHKTRMNEVVRLSVNVEIYKYVFKSLPRPKLTAREFCRVLVDFMTVPM